MKRTPQLRVFIKNAAMAFVLLFPAAALAEQGATRDATIDKAAAATSKATDETFLFYDLAEEKAKLVVRIETFRKDIKTLEEEKIPAARRDESRVSEAKARLDQLQRRESELNEQ